jgi:hypothetical protein
LPRDLAGGYERLRDAVRDPSRPLDGVAGLAIFIRQGMAAWMAACASVAAVAIDSAPGDLEVPISHTRQRDVIDVLATMVLTITQEATT